MTIDSFEPALKYCKPFTATEPMFGFFKYVSIDNDDARVIVISPTWEVKVQLNFKNGINACIRAFSFYKFIPFAGPYFAWYNGGAAAVKIIVSGIYLFDNKKEKAAEWCADAAQHAAFAAYNIGLCYFVSATLLNIPFIPSIYALAPDQVARLQNFLIDSKTGLFTAKTKDFIYKILNQPKPPDPPPSVSPVDVPRSPPHTPREQHHRRDSSWIESLTPSRAKALAQKLFAHWPGENAVQEKPNEE